MVTINLYMFLTTLMLITTYLIYIYMREMPAHFTVGMVMGYFFGLAKLHNIFYFYFVALVAAIVFDDKGKEND